MICIYIATSLETGKQYVGQTIDFEKRLGQHLRNKRNVYFDNVLQNHGLSSFRFDKLECDEEDLDRWEEFWIAKLNTIHPNGYNLTAGGGRCVFSEESRKKMSESHKGTVRSEEWRKNIGNAQRGEKSHSFGKKHTEETKRRMRDAHKGRQGHELSDETKAKIKASMPALSASRRRSSLTTADKPL